MSTDMAQRTGRRKRAPSKLILLQSFKCGTFCHRLSSTRRTSRHIYIKTGRSLVSKVHTSWTKQCKPKTMSVSKRLCISRFVNLEIHDNYINGQVKMILLFRGNIIPTPNSQILSRMSTFFTIFFDVTFESCPFCLNGDYFEDILKFF